MRFKLKATIYDKRGKVLSVGENSYVKTHPTQHKYSKRIKPGFDFLHAEIAAIVRCRHPDKAYRIVIERYTKSGKPALAKPCPICSLAIKEYGIEIVEWTKKAEVR